MSHYDRTVKIGTPSCYQCGSTAPADGFTEKTVIHQGRDPRTNKRCVDHTRFTVCKGTPCGGHLQMSFEG